MMVSKYFTAAGFSVAAARDETLGAQRAMASADDPDADALASLDVGDRAGALRRLMARHGSAVYRYCREALRDPTLAGDIQQQVFVEAYRDLPRFQRRSTVRVWLFAIARNRVLNVARQRQRGSLGAEDPTAVDAPDPAPMPAEFDHARLRAALTSCIDELPENSRTAVLLRYQQGFTFAEMAMICGESAGALCARVTRVLRLLRGRIEARGSVHAGELQ